jgi:hypothetical protein
VKISVIVPAFNEEKLLAASLAEINSAAAAFTARGGGRGVSPVLGIVRRGASFQADAFIETALASHEIVQARI